MDIFRRDYLVGSEKDGVDATSEVLFSIRGEREIVSGYIYPHLVVVVPGLPMRWSSRRCVPCVPVREPVYYIDFRIP
jgi:hypothetical protein